MYPSRFPTSPPVSRSASPLQPVASAPDQPSGSNQGNNSTPANASAHHNYPHPLHHQQQQHFTDMVSLRKDGWLNKLNAQSGLTAFAGSSLPSMSLGNSSNPSLAPSTTNGTLNASLTTSSSNHTSSSSTSSWKLTRASLKSGVLTISKPPSDLAVRAFDSSVPSQPLSVYAAAHPDYYPLTATVTSSSSSNNTATQNAASHRHAASIAKASSSKQPSSSTIHYLGTDPHPDLEYDRGRIVGGSDEAICHTILFGQSTSVTKTSVLLLPLLTDIVGAMEILTLYAQTPAVQVSRLRLVIETIQNSFPGMLLDNAIFTAFLRLVESVSCHDDAVANELKRSVVLKQKSMTEILSYASHQEHIMWSVSQPSVNEALSDRLHAIMNKHEHPHRNQHPHQQPPFQPSSLLQEITPDLILDLNVDVFAKQIYHFHLAFSKDWSPTTDISLLFTTKYTYNRHSPLVFDSTNIHFLGNLLLDHLFTYRGHSSSNHHPISNAYRGKIISYWINLGNALKNCGDMVGWLAIATVICSIPVLRLRSSWCYVPPDTRDRVTKEWAPVVFDLERRLMISDMTRKSTFHVLAPQGIGMTYPKERVVPFFGDLCVKYEEGSSYKQCEIRLNRIRTAFDRWKHYLEQIPQNDTFEPLPEAIPILQRLLYALLANHFSAPVQTPEDVLRLSLAIEPNFFGTYLKNHYSQRLPLQTGSYMPLLFTIVLPSYRLFAKTALLSACSTLFTSSSSFSSKRPLRPSSSRSGNSDSKQASRNGSGLSSSAISSTSIASISSSTTLSPAMSSPNASALSTSGVAELDFSSRNFIAHCRSSNALLKDVGDVLNVATRIYHLSDDIILKGFDEDSATTVPMERNNLPLALPLDGSQQQQQLANEQTLIINTTVKAANLERLVDILVLGVGDFSTFVNPDDMARYPLPLPPQSHAPGSDLSINNTIFKVDIDIHTMTFFATYRSFCSPSVLLESFRKRFVGAQSAALSISATNKRSLPPPPQNRHQSQHMQQGHVMSQQQQQIHLDSHFPNWDPTCDADPESIDWVIVAQIQIGVLEACHLWVSQYFSDFANDLRARDQFLDLLRNFEVELQTWKDAGVLLRDDYKYYYDTIEALHKKVRKLFIKKSYRPIDIKKLLPSFPQADRYENLLPNGDVKSLEALVDDLDTVAAEYFSMINLRDWMEVFEILETQSVTLTGLFNYRSMGSSNDDELVITDIFAYMESLYKASSEERLLYSFPRPLRELFKLRNHIIHYFGSQISDPTIKRDDRVARMMSILKILGIARTRMAPLDVFSTDYPSLNEDAKSFVDDDSHSSSVDQTYPISPHIASFVESAVAAAIVRPESRAFANSWLLASKEICKQFSGIFTGQITTIDSVVPDISYTLLARRSPLTPCVGWLLERLLEIVCYIPNMCVENSNLINFDKRRYTYILLTNILETKSSLQTFEARFNATEGNPALQEFSKRISYIVHPTDGLYHLDRRVAREAASRELKDYPRSASKNRVFAIYVVAEAEKLKRDSRQREVIERQAKELKKANSKMNKALSAGGSGQDASSISDRKTSKSRFGGFFKAVRPISMAFTGSFTPPTEKTIHPDDLPDIANMGDARFKQITSIKLIDSEITHLKAARDRSLFKVTSKGTEYWFQALNETDAEEWVRYLELARKHAYFQATMSNSAKVFGVSIRIVTEREGSFVPRVVETLLSEIEERGLEEVGIYRIPGSLASVNALKAAFDSGEDVNMKDDRWFDVNTVTGCFKLYLRELPEPLLTYDLLDEFVACGHLGFGSTGAGTEEAIMRLHSCVARLPPANYHLLRRLVQHLNKVTQFGESNRMHAVNLAIVFSMSLLPSSSSAAMMNADLGAMQTILKIMISSHERIFAEHLEPVLPEEETQNETIAPLRSETPVEEWGEHQQVSRQTTPRLSTPRQNTPRLGSVTAPSPETLLQPTQSALPPPVTTSSSSSLASVLLNKKLNSSQVSLGNVPVEEDTRHYSAPLTTNTLRQARGHSMYFEPGSVPISAAPVPILAAPVPVSSSSALPSLSVPVSEPPRVSTPVGTSLPSSVAATPVTPATQHLSQISVSPHYVTSPQPSHMAPATPLQPTHVVIAPSPQRIVSSPLVVPTSPSPSMSSNVAGGYPNVLSSFTVPSSPGVINSSPLVEKPIEILSPAPDPAVALTSAPNSAPTPALASVSSTSTSAPTPTHTPPSTSASESTSESALAPDSTLDSTSDSGPGPVLASTQAPAAPAVATAPLPSQLQSQQHPSPVYTHENPTGRTGGGIVAAAIQYYNNASGAVTSTASGFGATNALSPLSVSSSSSSVSGGMGATIGSESRPGSLQISTSSGRSSPQRSLISVVRGNGHVAALNSNSGAVLTTSKGSTVNVSGSFDENSKVGTLGIPEDSSLGVRSKRFSSLVMGGANYHSTSSNNNGGYLDSNALDTNDSFGGVNLDNLEAVPEQELDQGVDARHVKVEDERK